MKMLPLEHTIPYQSELICDSFRRSAPPHINIYDKILDNLKRALESGSYRAWLYGDDDGSKAIAVTTIKCDEVLDRKELIIVSASSLKKLSVADWKGCWDEMVKYATEMGCTHVVSYTVVDKIAEMSQLMGGDPVMKYLSIPIGG